MPSGVVSRERFRVARNSGFFCASIIPCTPVTQTYALRDSPTPPWMASNAWRISMAWTPTPSTLTRGYAVVCEFSGMPTLGGRSGQSLFSLHDFTFDPPVGDGESLLERDT